MSVKKCLKRTHRLALSQFRLPPCGNGGGWPRVSAEPVGGALVILAEGFAQRRLELRQEHVS